MSSGHFAKREREKAKRERADRKRERRETRRSEADEPTVAAEPDQADVLAQLSALHADFDEGRVTFDDFETAKAELLTRLQL